MKSFLFYIFTVLYFLISSSLWASDSTCSQQIINSSMGELDQFLPEQYASCIQRAIWPNKNADFHKMMERGRAEYETNMCSCIEKKSQIETQLQQQLVSSVDMKKVERLLKERMSYHIRSQFYTIAQDLLIYDVLLSRGQISESSIVNVKDCSASKMLQGIKNIINTSTRSCDPQIVQQQTELIFGTKSIEEFFELYSLMLTENEHNRLPHRYQGKSYCIPPKSYLKLSYPSSYSSDLFKHMHSEESLFKNYKSIKPYISELQGKLPLFSKEFCEKVSITENSDCEHLASGDMHSFYNSFVETMGNDPMLRLITVKPSVFDDFQEATSYEDYINNPQVIEKAMSSTNAKCKSLTLGGSDLSSYWESLLCREEPISVSDKIFNYEIAPLIFQEFGDKADAVLAEYYKRNYHKDERNRCVPNFDKTDFKEKERIKNFYKDVDPLFHATSDIEKMYDPILKPKQYQNTSKTRYEEMNEYLCPALGDRCKPEYSEPTGFASLKAAEEEVQRRTLSSNSKLDKKCGDISKIEELLSEHYAEAEFECEESQKFCIKQQLDYYIENAKWAHLPQGYRQELAEIEYLESKLQILEKRLPSYTEKIVAIIEKGPSSRITKKWSEEEYEEKLEKWREKQLAKIDKKRNEITSLEEEIKQRGDDLIKEFGEVDRTPYGRNTASLTNQTKDQLFSAETGTEQTDSYLANYSARATVEDWQQLEQYKKQLAEYQATSTDSRERSTSSPPPPPYTRHLEQNKVIVSTNPAEPSIPIVREVISEKQETRTAKKETPPTSRQTSSLTEVPAAAADPVYPSAIITNELKPTESHSEITPDTEITPIINNKKASAKVKDNANEEKLKSLIAGMGQKIAEAERQLAQEQNKLNNGSNLNNSAFKATNSAMAAIAKAKAELAKKKQQLKEQQSITQQAASNQPTEEIITAPPKVMEDLYAPEPERQSLSAKAPSKTASNKVQNRKISSSAPAPKNMSIMDSPRGRTVKPLEQILKEASQENKIYEYPLYLRDKVIDEEGLDNTIVRFGLEGKDFKSVTRDTNGIMIVKEYRYDPRFKDSKSGKIISIIKKNDDPKRERHLKRISKIKKAVVGSKHERIVSFNFAKDTRYIRYYKIPPENESKIKERLMYADDRNEMLRQVTTERSNNYYQLLAH